MDPDPAPSPPTPDRATVSPSEYEAERRRKRQELVDLGINPYGRRVENVTPLADVRAAATANPATRDPVGGPASPRAVVQDAGQTQLPTQEEGPVFTVAGRIVLKRDMGKLTFLTLRDDTGDLQVGLQKNKLDDLAWEVRNRLDLGDQIVATGPLGVTKTGEPTIWATNLQMSSKSLLVPPDKHKGLEDVELRYRQRYVDFWANPEAMRLAKLRIEIVERVRRFWRDKGFLEVETPMLQPLHGGAAARPFETHMNALDMPLYLRIAPELYLKRLLVGGFRKVFEVNRNFRNEGISPRHNPEFTMLEAYEAYGNYETMARLVEEMVCTIAQEVLGSLVIEHKNEQGEVTRRIDLRGNESTPLGQRWRRVRMVDIVEERTGWRFDKGPLQGAAGALLEKMAVDRAEAFIDHLYEVGAEGHERRGMEMPSKETFVRENIKPQGFQNFFAEKLRTLTPAEQLVEVYEKLVEPTLIDPTFVTHVPSVIIPLARPSEEDPYFAEVYELAVNGAELSPGYTELNDPDVQERLFRAQVCDEAERQQIDEDFLTALKYGMPPAGGMGLGVDRLVTMLTGAPSLRDIILFPLMRHKGEKTEDRRRETGGR